MDCNVGICSMVMGKHFNGSAQKCELNLNHEHTVFIVAMHKKCSTMLYAKLYRDSNPSEREELMLLA